MTRVRRRHIGLGRTLRRTGAAAILLVGTLLTTSGAASATVPHRTTPEGATCLGADHLVLVFDDAKSPAEYVNLFLLPQHAVDFVSGPFCTSQAGRYSASKQRIELRLHSGEVQGCRLHGVPTDPATIAEGVGWIGTGRCGTREVFWSLTYGDA